jgi:hypothetical protein
MQGVKGEAVVVYADPLRTQQMLYHRLSRRVNNMAVFLDITRCAFQKYTQKDRKERLLLLF